MELPYMMWFPSDWQSDLGLRRCSLTAKGLWIEMLQASWKHAGELRDDKKQPLRTAEEIGDYLVPTEPIEVVRSALVELERRGIFSRSEEGIIFSRRQVRDHKERTEKSALARKRWDKFEKKSRRKSSKLADAPAYAGGNTAASQNAHAASGSGYRYGSGSSSLPPKEEGVQREEAAQPSGGATASVPASGELAFMLEASVAGAKAEREADRVAHVVAHYQSIHPRARPGEKELRLIRARMGDGFSVEDLCHAIDGNHFRAFNVKNNQHSLELIVRDASHVNMYLDAYSRGPEAALSDKARTTELAGQQWLAMHEEAERRGQG